MAKRGGTSASMVGMTSVHGAAKPPTVMLRFEILARHQGFQTCNPLDAKTEPA